MIINKSYSNDSKDYFNSIIKVLPSTIEELVKDTHINFFEYDNGFLNSYIPEGHKEQINKISYFSPLTNAIYIGKRDLYGNFWGEKANFSAILHEVGHALDFKLNWISNRMPKSINLDRYASLNKEEQFAQCFEAYFRNENKPTNICYEHTIRELSKKAPEYLNLFNHLSNSKEVNI